MGRDRVTQEMVEIAARIAIAVHPGYVSQRRGRVWRWRFKTGRRTRDNKAHWAKLGSLSFEYIEFLAEADEATQDEAINRVARRWRADACRRFPGWDTHVFEWPKFEND